MTSDAGSSRSQAEVHDGVRHDLAAADARQHVVAPELNWNDYAGIDMRGKIAVILVNDPDSNRDDRGFGGRAMTYYGRWTYKFEEAERRGAAGMLIIHNTERAGYGWPTVVGSWAKEQRMLPRDPQNSPPPLGVRGWITEAPPARCCNAPAAISPRCANKPSRATS
ncbi:MAG: hypothetical protein HC777_00855, partial [Hyphomonadaceae bacterium]|nr:hypothetical protein [Hyphomonadaceae bacterium]